jgi:competence ComEA-like helix-hairpin-helix protein
MATSSTGIAACLEERRIYPENRRACATSRYAQLVDRRGNVKFGSSALLLVASVAALFLYLAPALGQKTPPTQPINLNTATIAQLETLPGIGPNTAKSIVDFRNHSGPFQRVEDLLAIKGISKSKLEKLRPYVTVGPKTPNRHSDSPHQASAALAFSSPNFQRAM